MDYFGALDLICRNFDQWFYKNIVNTTLQGIYKTIKVKDYREYKTIKMLKYKTRLV